jgi:predicted nucleic acid-binding Zn ribbon protein
MQSIRSFSSGVLSDIIRRQPPSPARTSFAWQIAAGQQLARATRVNLDEAGVLTVHAIDERWLPEVRRAAGTLLPRLQDLLGRDQITRIKI